MMNDILEQNQKARLEPITITSTDQLMRFCCKMGKMLADGADLLSDGVTLTPETRREIGNGNFAIGPERERIVVASNIAFYAMVYYVLKIADDVSVKDAIENHNHGTFILANIVRDYQNAKQCVCGECEGSGKEVNPAVFFQMIQEGAFSGGG